MNTLSHRLRICAGFVLAILTLGSLRAADPAYYVRQSTWQLSRLASEEALARQHLESGFAGYESDTRRGGAPAQFIQVNVAGAREMYLFVTGCPDIRWAVADWADATLIGKNGQAIPLSRLESSIKILQGRHEYDLTLRSGLYQKMKLAGRTFDQGLHVQAYSAVRVPLDGKYERFEATIGVDDWAGTNGTVRFSVLGARDAAYKRLWELLERDFPDGLSRRQMRWEQEDRIFTPAWLPGNLAPLAKLYAQASHRVPALAAPAAKFAAMVRDDAGLAITREWYYRSRELEAAGTRAKAFNFQALRLAIEDLGQTYGEKYPQSVAFLDRLNQLESALRAALNQVRPASLASFEKVSILEHDLDALRREALLANPLLDFDRLLLVKRKPLGDPRRSQWDDRGLGEYFGLPKQSSWHLSTIPRVDIWENEIAVLSPVRPEGKINTLYKPEGQRLLTDVDLHFDADKMLFSMPDANLRWQIHEIRADGSHYRQLTPGDQPEVHNYDSCYLPNGNIAFLSTAPLQGVPCNAGVVVGMMYLMDPNGNHIHQVAFEQDHDYCPSVLNDGRILYLRWDYTDTPHVWNRILMAMNPDGTSQMEYYGSGSYWPNAVFFARAIPGHPTKIAGIVTGHHEGRIGELVIFDPARGRQEVEGVVQRIPGYGQPVEPKIEDKLTEHSWPKFLHPAPLSEKYFIVACKPEPDSLFGIYLVDVFDNRILLREEENYALLEPIPFRKTPKPPIIPDKVLPDETNAVVFLQDVYEGPGLKGVPRGSVKQLRLFTYHFGYQRVAGIDHRVGADGPWEVKRVLGTVPVESDGSALFRIPAKYPISVQPLDAEGQALALMRSWMTAMPGEILSCIGCHERQGTSPPVRQSALALSRPPSDIEPWRGPPRGFSFAREVQPVLDKYCVSCHQGAALAGRQSRPDLRADQGAFVVYAPGSPVGQRITGVPKKELLGHYSGVFEPSYVELRKFVRVGGLESDLHLLLPKEFHANTSELIQMLKKGHHNVKLDKEAWDVLATWIDLNAPCHGTWAEVTRIPGQQQPERRQFLRRLYGGIDENAEAIPDLPRAPVVPVVPEPVPPMKTSAPQIAGWPLRTDQAQRRQKSLGRTRRVIDMGGGVKMEFVRVPAGTFVMGDPDGETDEQPLSAVEIKQPFWMGACEVLNEQYARFDPRHDSRFEDRSSWIFSEEYLGWPLNQPRQPVVRVSWNQAMAFCQWLSKRTGECITLHTEAQWEYACRAGTATPFWYGSIDADFSTCANLGDENLKRLAYDGWRPLSPDLVPRDSRFNDRALVTAEAGRYQPNPWGLFDMHGNAAEWTRSSYRPYPYRPELDQVRFTMTTLSGAEEKVVRGGSWRDRPKRSRSAFRLSYPAYQPVFNVGFRVIIEADNQKMETATR
jgi:formylglycine-generating enzyme required for sulfatase activity